MSTAEAGSAVDHMALTVTDVAFMREQHSRTIFELRSEITLLRQKNADMTMAAALSHDIADELAALKGTANGYLAKLTSERSETEALQKELMGGATYIKSLEINAGQFEEREGALQQQLVEVEAARQQDHSLIRQLKSELDNRSANSARLMAQLHKAKVQYKQYVDKVEDQGAAEGAYDDAFAVEDEDVEVGAGACGDSGEGSAFPSPPKASLNQLRMRRRASYVSPDRPQGAPGAPSSPHSSFRTSVRKAPAPSTGNTTGYTVVASTHRPPRQEEIQSTQAQLPVFPTPMPPIRRQGSSNSSLTRHMRRAVPTDSATP